jgi:undecaprenyl-diphosphatase
MLHELDFRSSDPELDPKPVALVGTATAVSLVVVVLGALLLGWLTEEVMEAGPRGYDLEFRNWLHQFASPGYTRAAFLFSWIGDQVLILLLIVSLAVFLILRWRRATGWMLTSMGGALVLDLAMKFGFHRPRPQPFFGTMPHTYSFPSGHALFALCFFGVLAGLLADRIDSRALQTAIWAAALALIGAIGLSRIYLGVHYPSDVVAGYLTAAVWVSAILVLDHARMVRNSMKLP